MHAWRMVLVAVLATGTLRAADPPEELTALRKQWDTQRARADGERAATVEKALAAYEGELKILLANVRQQGDLDYVTAIQDELKRLETDRSAPTKPAAKRMEHLRKAQWGARQTEDKADKERDAKLAKLVAEYTAQLDALQKQLVKENRIEEAKEVRSERQTVDGGMIEGSARLSLGGVEHTLAEFKAGAKAKDGTSATWREVPEELRGWLFARSRGNPGAVYSVRAIDGGVIRLLVRAENIERAWGWRRTPMKAVMADGAWSATYVVVEKSVAAGEKLSTPQIPDGYTIPVVRIPSR